MAVYNEIGIGRWNRFIQKLTDMKGGPPARQLASEIAFAHGIFHGSENRYLESWDRFGVNNFVAAVAGQRAAVCYRNPVGSNVVAVFEKITIWNTLTDQPTVQLYASTVDLTPNALSNVRLDARGRPQPTLINSQSGTGPALLNQIWQGSFPANSQVDVMLTSNHEVTVLPGDRLTISSGVLNQVLNVAAFWRERFLEPAERF